MNRLIFEGRFLVNMAATIVRQDDMRIIHKRVNWEQMYRIADYHRIANMIYLGILGNGEMVPPRWRDHFFERYQQALRFGEACEDGEREILTLLDMMKVPCIILASCAVRTFYQIQETAGNSPLRLYLDHDSYVMAKGFLVDLGYETDQNFSGCGERMRRSSGFTVEIYYKLPFRTRLYEKNMLLLMEHAYLKTSYQYVRTLSLEDRFIFRMAQAIYHYVTDELIIREMLDLFLYHQKWREQMNQEYVNRKLGDMRIDELSAKLLHLVYMWFGSSEEKAEIKAVENMEAYDVMENRLLSQGAITKETDQQALILAKLISQDINKENRLEKWNRIKRKCGKCWAAFMKKVRWVFPEYKYMCAVYPILEKISILLPLCWLRRLVRFGLEAITRRR